jgi:hypothetical protein
MSSDASALYKELRTKASSAPLSELLHSLVILAGDVQNVEVERWAKLELGGYLKDNPAMGQDIVLPEYRNVVGMWYNQYGQGLRFDSDMHFVNLYRLRNGVAELERLSQTDKFHSIVDPSCAEMFRKADVYVDHFEFNSRDVAGILSNIRTRLIESLGNLRDGVQSDSADEDTDTKPATEHVLPFDVVKDTRGYLEKIVNQANGCYEKGWYDACSVMIRKLVELLLIAVYEEKKEAATIKEADGNFLMLADLVGAITARNDWNLGRETKKALPLVKALGDASAHHRHYFARKADVDKVLPGLRLAVEDLLHQAGFRK